MDFAAGVYMSEAQISIPPPPPLTHRTGIVEGSGVGGGGGGLNPGEG
jgi:hypothetical protein